MNTTDITNMSDYDLDDLLDSAVKTFECPGCGETVNKSANYEFGMGCDDCIDSAPTADYYDDSWGDHNPNYDY